MNNNFFYKSCLAVISILGFGCSAAQEKDFPAQLAKIAGELAAQHDLREVQFEDLDGDGMREVILLYGPRELLNFDVYFRLGDSWQLTPPVNDQNNPREFISTNLDSISRGNEDGLPLISVSSKLYDGNLMVKEIHWSRTGYQVVGQRTVLAKPPAPAPSARTLTKRVSSGTATEVRAKKTVKAVSSPLEQKEAVKQRSIKPKPTSKPTPVLKPAQAVYIVRKGNTLIGLARILAISIGELEKLNGNQLQSRGLRIGQRINVPVPKNALKNVKLTIEKTSYRVKRGDSLSSIAKKYGTSVRALKSWNQNLPASGKLIAGKSIRIHRAVITIAS